MVDAPVVTVSAASRQKNCNACVQGKRRCDRRTPICSRCRERDVSCVYGKARGAPSQSRNYAENLEPYTETLDFGSPICSILPDLSLDMDYLGIIPIDPQLDGLVTQNIPTSIMESASNNDTSMDLFMDLMDNGASSDKQQWLVPADNSSIIERPSSPIDEESLLAFDKMVPVCESVAAGQIYDPNTPLYYLVTRLKAFTTEAATHNSTPFMHKYLYKDNPLPCIVSCFSANVLYANRTPTNMAMTMRALTRDITELVETETGRQVAAPMEKLARTQSLFLYQIIRLFDGDVTLRAHGEKDIPLLQIWLGELCKVRENLGELAGLEDSLVRSRPPEDWNRWMFEESVRRTIMMGYSVMTLYDMMRNSEATDSQKPWAFIHRWTLSRHLWEAESSFSFLRTWREKPQYIINNYTFDKFLKYGKGDDVDKFAEILLSVYVGVDEVKEFLSASA